MAGPHVLAIRKVADGHCARGATRCAKCKTAQETSRVVLVKLFLLASGNAAPVLFTEVDGAQRMCEYETVQEFASADEARAYAAANGVGDVKLD